MIAALLAMGACPGALKAGSALPPRHPRVSAPPVHPPAAASLDLGGVREDIIELLTDSQPAWPADYGHYGGLFVRLAWHCSGSYRESDGRGGCAGGRQRFDPERAWEDNTNLDKARALLEPIKAKHGAALSYGDLYVLAGTTAIEAMGGPSLGFCAGRIDDETGAESEALGPSAVQQELAPCPKNGTCTAPLGSTTVGLIYLNPEGPMGVPEPPGASAPEIRDTFARMGMDDAETVALIGAHTLGKAHGACPAGAGPGPDQQPNNPWPGLCGTGKGKDTFTSGFEGAWTANPTRWDNEYFVRLLETDWEVHLGPGGHFQWRAAGSNEGATMALTSDVALLHDRVYRELVARFAVDPEAFDRAFASAWYKLTTRDMGPATRCVGDAVPPPQPWQFPLPPPPANPPDPAAVAAEVTKAMLEPNPVLEPDKIDGIPTYGPLFVRLAWQCAATFRDTDKFGGCNGARIRFRPQKEWAINAALDAALEVLQPVKDRFGEALTWADLIVIAGNTALEAAGSGPLEFCAGRADALPGDGGPDFLTPRIEGAFTERDVVVKDVFAVMGLTRREMAVLNGGGHSLGQMHEGRSGFRGRWTTTNGRLDNGWFKTLLGERWEEYEVASTGARQFKAMGKDLFMLASDLVFLDDPELRRICEEYAADEALFLADFAHAWAKMMNADRFGAECASATREIAIE